MRTHACVIVAIGVIMNDDDNLSLAYFTTTSSVMSGIVYAYRVGQLK